MKLSDLLFITNRMAWLKFLSLLFISTVSALTVNSEQVRLPTFVIPHNGEAMIPTSCSDNAWKGITDAVSNILQDVIVPRIGCGEGDWYRVAYLNMSDPSQQCPSAWREDSSHGIRVCARPVVSESTPHCLSALYTVDRQYTKVCGRAIGYQFGSTDAFRSNLFMVTPLTIDDAYVDGISITHGSPRNHIWTYTAASSTNTSICSTRTCPCASTNSTTPPSFVGDNYYCETAYDGINDDHCFVTSTFFPDDPLWDGEQCSHEGTCCTGTNTPPWFSVNLGSQTSDDIEVRICGDEDTKFNEDTPIQLLEIYIQ